MKMTREYGEGQNIITAYGGGGVQVNQVAHHESVVVLPDQLIPQWPVSRVDDLKLEALEPVLALSPEIVLLGTGPTLRWPPREVLYAIRAQGIGLEVMDTSAACRTYNIVMGEGRRVAAVLLIPG
ncbi:Mth938-like domain-containing protein [Ectothiorhodospira sp. BSL-9]|uniref:Mth938-like domain-containing protein n=1 Tax=Ectothiorhodospira sp. BSL-9 TaxID=1442136 RepID=UPI0007B44F87|nr:Mth938-like domain-containing protein [Ectothiorhodospira sp. BSL-9]ANB03069.1 hypothetical protein ECTOBSL9_2632 [Ectothiorhodospira sp. BSL-9]